MRHLSVSLRATETQNLFNFVIGGKDVNHGPLSGDEDLLRKCLWENSGRQKQLKFGKIPWLSHYT